jgi:Ca2+:H+ antiporter
VRGRGETGSRGLAVLDKESSFEVVAVAISVLAVGFVSMDGETHWMGGAMLVGVYLILASAFYFLPA